MAKTLLQIVMQISAKQLISDQNDKGHCENQVIRTPSGINRVNSFIKQIHFNVALDALCFPDVFYFFSYGKSGRTIQVYFLISTTDFISEGRGVGYVTQCFIILTLISGLLSIKDVAGIPPLLAPKLKIVTE